MLCKPVRVADERCCSRDVACGICAPNVSDRDTFLFDDQASIDKQITERQEKLERERALLARKMESPRSFSHFPFSCHVQGSLHKTIFKFSVQCLTTTGFVLGFPCHGVEQRRQSVTEMLEFWVSRNIRTSNSNKTGKISCKGIELRMFSQEEGDPHGSFFSLFMCQDS